MADAERISPLSAKAPAPDQPAFEPANFAAPDAESQEKPGKGLLGWLGRQVGYVTRAIHADIGGPKVLYRENQVREVAHPTDPTLKLRRTVIDEVIEDK